MKQPTKSDGAERGADPPPAEPATITVLRAKDHPLTKRFYLDEQGVVQRENFQNAYLYYPQTLRIKNIDQMSDVLMKCATSPYRAVIRGVCSSDPRQAIRKISDNFPEHAEGTRWVMLDIDGVTLPDRLSSVSVEAIRWLIKEKLPEEFRRVTCHFQFSGSSGILDAAGNLLKTGLRVHLFYFLDRRIRGEQLAAYLRLFCVKSGFFSVGQNKGDAVPVTYGIDPAPIRSSVQLHYVANPIIEKGVVCKLKDDDRNGVLPGDSDVVVIPTLDSNIVRHANSVQRRLRTDWQKANGYLREKIQVRTNTGIAVIEQCRSPNKAAQVGRKLINAEPQGDFCTLFFEGEGTAGSWYVGKFQPQVARRYGDGTAIPLQELCDEAYRYVRDGLKWFQEIPHQSLRLGEAGYVQPFDEFIGSKYALVLAPTGSGKTRAMIDWVRERSKAALVIYVAQTIPLVNQMQEDLLAQGIECEHYGQFHYKYAPVRGVFATTNESLPRVLGLLESAQLTAYDLVIDEFHVALDDFCRNTTKYAGFTKAISKARTAIFMTGTLTDVQRLMLTSILSKLEGGPLAPERYCCYEFDAVKRNPLRICKLADFDADVVELLKRLKADLDAKRPLPKVMLSVSSSKLEAFRDLLGSFGLTDESYVVSRQEVLQQAIDEARIGDKPILVSSPLFSIGLNFTRALEILYCRFDKIPTDTSRIIQTINRANRGAVACEVRIYAGETDSSPFYFPPKAALEEKMKAALAEEYSGGYNGTELPQILDLMTYQHYRKIESVSSQALGNLISDDGFQNYAVVEEAVDPAVDEPRAADRRVAKKQAVQARKAATSHYDARVLSKLPSFVDDVTDIHFWRLRLLYEESKRGTKEEDDRVPLEIAEDRYAVLMNLCGITDVKLGRRLDRRKLQILFGDREPWLTDQFSPAENPGWALVAAQKTANLIPLLNVIQSMRQGDIDGLGFAIKLNRDKKLRTALKALVISGSELVTLSEQFETLSKLREVARGSRSKESKAAADNFALALTRELLEPVGVFFPVVGKGRDRQVDYTDPQVPLSWDLERMVHHLKRREVLLTSLPKGIGQVGRSLVGRGLYSSPISQCRSCRFFDAQCCALERYVDWSEEGYEAPLGLTLPCEDFWPLPAALV